VISKLEITDPHGKVYVRFNIVFIQRDRDPEKAKDHIIRVL